MLSNATNKYFLITILGPRKTETPSMALRHRVPQADMLTDMPPASATVSGIPAEITAQPGLTAAQTGKGETDSVTIDADSQASVLLSTVATTHEQTILVTTSPTATATPSATPAPASTGLATGAIVGIVVAVVAVLLIPAAYLIWRSHQIKKEGEWRASQRSSQEAMIVKETVEPKRDNGPPPPRPRRSPSDTPRERPANSLGLFNFDLGSPTPAPTSPQKESEGAKGGPRLSIARTLQMRRSEVSIVNQERRSQQQIADLRNGLRNNPPTKRNSRDNLAGSPPPPYSGAATPDSKFAPLNNIGTAVSAGRPKFSRNGSTSTIPRQPSPPPQQEMPRPRTAAGPRRPPPGTQDMRQGPMLLTAQNLPPSRIANPPVSAYSMSNYHDSFRPEPKLEPKAEPKAEPSLQPPEQVVYGRAVSPIHRSISPINNYQLPTLGLSSNDRFSWGVGGTTTTTNTTKDNEMERRRKNNHDTERQNHEESAERRSDVSGLSYDPADDNRKSNGRAISPVESDEDPGMRTREYL